MMFLSHYDAFCNVIGSFSIDDGNGGEKVLQKMYLYFTFECCSYVDEFSTPVGLKTRSD